MTTTPRTDEKIFITHAGSVVVGAGFARQLERKLSKVTEQRDRLLAATKEFIDVQSLISGVFRLEEYVSHIKKLNAIIREIEESKEP